MSRIEHIRGQTSHMNISKTPNRQDTDTRDEIKVQILGIPYKQIAFSILLIKLTVFLIKCQPKKLL